MTSNDYAQQQQAQTDQATVSESEVDSELAAHASEAGGDDSVEHVDSPDEPAAAVGEPVSDPFTVVVNGESATIDTSTTAAELGTQLNVDQDVVFTYRTPDGVEALSGDQTVANAIEDGAELWTQPLGDGEVFG